MAHVVFSHWFAIVVLIMAASSTETKAFYRIGVPGVPWGDAECAEWKTQTKRQRSYKDDVLSAIEALKESFDVEQYGALPHDPERYPLYIVKTRNWKSENPFVLITGGVHGYETSGVKGALLFLQTQALDYAAKFNILVAPCVSPWAWEHIQRWQADLQDPNRSFQKDDPKAQTDEAKALMEYIHKKVEVGSAGFTCHLDLHETTDTDETEFMPAKHAKAGLMYDGETIPDGFYVVANNELPDGPQLDFQDAIINSVRKVTHIAPPDDKGNIIDEPVVREGVIVVPAKTLGLCCSFTGAKYQSTTEVYPDSPKATDDDCNHAQVAAVVGALDYILVTQQTS